MNISIYKTAIKTWVEAQTSLPAQWRNEAGGWISKTRILMRLFAPIGVGVDHLRWGYEEGEELEEGEAPTDYIPKVCGDRQITLSLYCEGRDPTGDEGAIWHLMKLRASLVKPSVKLALYTAGLAYSTIEAPIDLTETLDDRRESRASMDVHFNAVENELDYDEADGYCESAVPTGDIVAEE